MGPSHHGNSINNPIGFVSKNKQPRKENETPILQLLKNAEASKQSYLKKNQESGNVISNADLPSSKSHHQ